ncbi:MAG: YkgJ family cysteine cluster protein [Proteobacteria bacterium]|nr:YkgJ family cysteine cluster protein [Pseudomonadota bacterium]
MTDESQEFLDSLPELKKGETYAFACHPGVECFNACCGDLNLMLTPYDVYRLRKELEKPSRDFIQGYCEVAAAGNAGFPMAQLRMLDNPKRSCPFVRSAGCSVYGNRPGACRTYPLGRAARMANDGSVIEQYFIVQESHCKGFEEDKQWTSQEWLADQGMEEYNEFNDQYMVLINRFAGLGMQLDAKKLNIAFLALYQLDDFQQFIRQMKLFDRVLVSEERQAAILADELEALRFGLDWIELMLFGESENLERKI